MSSLINTFVDFVLTFLFKVTYCTPILITNLNGITFPVPKRIINIE